jgi:hypothetical protein
MRHAELAWRTELARQTVAGIAQSIERRFPDARPNTLTRLLGTINAGSLSAHSEPRNGR